MSIFGNNSIICISEDWTRVFASLWHLRRRKKQSGMWMVGAAGQALGILGDSKVAVSQEAASGHQQPGLHEEQNHQQGGDPGWESRPCFLLSVLKTWLESRGSVPCSPVQQRHGLPEESSVRALEHLLYKKRVREPRVFSPEKCRLGRAVPMCGNSWVKGMKKREPENYPITESEVRGTSWSMRNFIKA